MGGELFVGIPGGVARFSMPYSTGFKSRMVQRMTGPAAIAANSLAQEVGVPQTTLSRWLKLARTVGNMTDGNNNSDRPKSTRQWSIEERRQVVAEAATLPESLLGAFLRGKGIHMAQLEQWRAEGNETMATSSASTTKKRGGKLTAEQRRNRELEKKLSQSEKKLQQSEKMLTHSEKKLRAANALLDLQKKVPLLTHQWVPKQP